VVNELGNIISEALVFSFMFSTTVNRWMCEIAEAVSQRASLGNKQKWVLSIAYSRTLTLFKFKFTLPLLLWDYFDEWPLLWIAYSKVISADETYHFLHLLENTRAHYLTTMYRHRYISRFVVRWPRHS